MRQVLLLLMAAILAFGAAATPADRALAAGPVVGSYSRVATGSLNVRSGPGYGHGVLMRMPKGAIARIISGPHNSGWYKIKYRGATGYSLGSHLRHTGLVGKGLASGYGKLIVVSLAKQQLEAYEGGELVLISAVRTGRPEKPSPVGTFSVLRKASPATFTSPYPEGSPYYYEPWTASYAMRYKTGGFAIHDSTKPYPGYGSNVPHVDPDGVTRTGSLGCVNMPLWSMGKLYNWASVGTTIKIVSY